MSRAPTRLSRRSNRHQRPNHENETGAFYDLLGDFAPEHYTFYRTPRSVAERVMLKFGGPRPMLRALKRAGYDLAPSTVYKWLYPKEKGGTGGHIPTQAWPKILEAAKLEGIILTAEDFDHRKFPLKNPGERNNSMATIVAALEAPRVFKKSYGK